MESKFRDGLTGIFNEEYLKKNYQSYLDKHPDSNFIMIDFEKFKSINDTFGHNVGDDYLRTFAKILESNFKDSLVVRLHGDEFVILTKYSEDYIDEIFGLCDQKISLAVLEGKIPRVFGYNAGSVKAEHSINGTKEKADFMMYHAKKNHLRYQRFLHSILQEKERQDGFFAEIDFALKDDAFSYTTRQLFCRDSVGQNIFQIYTKGKDGNSIFDNGRYDILKNTSKLLQFDIHNIQQLLERSDFSGHKIIITIDYKSLISMPDFIIYLSVLKKVSSLDLDNIILSIDLNGLEFVNYKRVIESVINLKGLGIAVRLDKFDSTIGDEIWEETDVNYIKIASNYWKRSMNNPKIASSLKSKIEVFDSCRITPVFEFIEQAKELEFLKKITPDDTLFSGNYFSKEKRLVFRKD